MKKLNISSFLPIIIFLAISCSKKDVLLPETNPATQDTEQSGEFISFENLPEQYRKAKKVLITEENMERVSKRIVTGSYGPYGNTNEPNYFGIPLGGHQLLMIGIGKSELGKPNLLVLWYRDLDGILVMYTSGEPVGSQLQLRYTLPGEYIRGVGGYYGTHLNRLEIYTNKSALYVGQTTGTRFIDIPGPGFEVSYIFGYAALQKIGKLSYLVEERPWAAISGSSAKDIAVDTAGTIYKINNNGVVLRKTANAGNWSAISSNFAASRIAANAGRVYVTNGLKIYRLSGSTWIPTVDLPENVNDLTIDAGGMVWAINSVGNIYTLEGGTWVRRPGSSGSRIATGGVTGQNSQVWLVNRVGKIYKWNNALNRWDQTAGSDGTDIAVDDDYNTWLLNSVGKLYRYDYFKKDWLELKSPYASTISANSKKVVIIKSAGELNEMNY